MQHGLMYQGSFEQNYPNLEPGSSSFTSTDGSKRPLPDWPSEVDGLRVGYMEKAGKKFLAVRVQYEDRDIVLEEPVVLDPMRHMGSRRFSPEPTIIDDELASTLLDDMIKQNPGQRDELALLINRINQVRRTGR